MGRWLETLARTAWPFTVVAVAAFLGARLLDLGFAGIPGMAGAIDGRTT